MISEELQSSQSQMSRFKRERDAYRHMVEESQKTGKDRPASISVDEVCIFMLKIIIKRVKNIPSVWVFARHPGVDPEIRSVP